MQRLLVLICIISANHRAAASLPACVVSAVTTTSEFAFDTAARDVKVMSQYDFPELHLLSVVPPPTGH